MTTEKEKVRNNHRFRRVRRSVLRMRRKFKMASTYKGVPVPPIYESCYSVMDEHLSLSLHFLDQSERELCGNEVYLVLLHGVSSS